MHADDEIEQVMRTQTRTPRGPMKIQRHHVTAAVKSRSSQSTIGSRRADKIWGWIATAMEGSHRLKNKEEWTQQWISDTEKSILKVRAAAAWAESDPGEVPAVRKAEMVGAVEGWLVENEELNKGVYLIRAPKMRQLRDARKNMASKRGGAEAISAAIVLLSAEGKATMERAPRLKGQEGRNKAWIQNSIDWMVQQGWVSEAGRTSLLKKATATYNKHKKEDPSWYTVDMGEGWGSVRRAMQEWEGETGKVEVIGVDRRGHTQTGAKHGIITAAVNLDFTQQNSLLEAVATKGGAAMSRWLMVWLSPECTLFSMVSAINQKKGASHGKWASTEQNRKNAGEQRVKEEKKLTKEATAAVYNQIKDLETHPAILFALENPMTSDLWNLTKVEQAIKRNPTWRLIRVDQCAFGRLSQKPTLILTNIASWVPTGLTGDGKCEVGTCAGTVGNPTGSRAHKEQTVANTKGKRATCGQMVGAVREYKRDTVINAVESALIQEILTAAEEEKLETGMEGMKSERKMKVKKRKRQHAE